MEEKIGTVVLIDDEQITHRQYNRILSRSGLVEDIISFTYADEALDYMKSNPSMPFDIILLDINMPRMNGFEFLEAVEDDFKQKIAHVLIVMLTTSLNPNDREKAEKNPLVTDFITKPLNGDKVEKIIKLLAHNRTQNT